MWRGDSGVWEELAARADPHSRDQGLRGFSLYFRRFGGLVLLLATRVNYIQTYGSSYSRLVSPQYKTKEEEKG